MSFAVQCQFSNNILASTSYINEYDPDIGGSGSTSQTIDMRNKFKIELFEDTTHAIPLTDISVGSKVYAKVTPPALPFGVQAYYEKCVITDGTRSFHVFDNYQCKSIFAQVAQDNVPADTYVDYKFDYSAFAFVNQPIGQFELVSILQRLFTKY